MNHCSDDDLVLHFYGEDERPRSHLAACVECASRYRALTAVLQTVGTLDVPERGDQYGLEVWQGIRHRLPERAPWWLIGTPLRRSGGQVGTPLRRSGRQEGTPLRRSGRQVGTPLRRSGRQGLWWPWAAAAAAAVVLLAVGFTAGRIWQPDSAPQVAEAPPTLSDDERARRVLLLTVADHLDQSDRVLTDVVNAPGGIDISSEQAWAVDLVAASRLYRQEAVEVNETSLAAVLDEIERTLLEIVHRPSTVTDADLNEIRRRVDSAALLFKVRVMSSELRELTGELTKPDAAPSSDKTPPMGSARDGTADSAGRLPVSSGRAPRV
jgi:hypothetical protein